MFSSGEYHMYNQVEIYDTIINLEQKYKFRVEWVNNEFKFGPMWADLDKKGKKVVYIDNLFWYEAAEEMVLAGLYHEIGHLENHFKFFKEDEMIINPIFELEADYFAASIFPEYKKYFEEMISLVIKIYKDNFNNIPENLEEIFWEQIKFRLDAL
jgi:hypothetical protein